ncbi:hypothetical protein [Deinococcus sp. 12RED42]|uniref:hypothetical protein n=1 Tax=Deinococcus sp. 12RED42 TaxID=2745872 RepID=UPI001E5E933F|nr:hypothetical protein [Deinococcus sp. 12RED42]MCD0167960.1 hypothetical protein [Deinococcus sp. 12RED42]
MTPNHLHLTAALIAGQASREPAPTVTVSRPKSDRYDLGKTFTPGVVFGNFHFHAPDWKTPRSHPFQPRPWESA